MVRYSKAFPTTTMDDAGSAFNQFSSSRMRSVEASAIVTPLATGTPQVKGWCPGALRPMLSGDGLVLRVRPHGGRLSQAQAAGIAELAVQHGNGLLDLTSRANLQIRGVQPSSQPALVEGLQALGLLDDSPEIEARRNILVSPFAQDGDGTTTLDAELAHALAMPDAPPLPEKFGFSVDCGKHPVLRDSSADIRIERAPGGFLVSAYGFATGALVASADAVPAALDLARWYLAATAGHNPRGRMTRIAPYATLPARFQTTALPTPSTSTPQVGPTANGWLVGIELGQLSATTLATLSNMGDLRITPWRLLLIEGAHQTPEVCGLITHADDPRLRVVACIGAPGCLQGHTATRHLARAMAPLVPVGRLLHVSGCAKGCAHPKDSLTLVGTPTGMNLVRYGKASSAPDLQALAPETIAAYLTQQFKSVTPHASPI